MANELQNIEKTVKNAVKNLEDTLKEYKVDARKWNFSVGKEDDAMIISVQVEVAIKKK